MARLALAVFVLSLALGPVTLSRVARGDVLDQVDVFVGTGGTGFGAGATYPGPCVPFGFARPGPDTSNGLLDMPFQHFSGYDHKDGFIRGFSHTRLSGIGVPDYGNLLVMPTLNKGPLDDPSSYRARFRHDDEHARPGSYVVTLQNKIRCELTATQLAAGHRYTPPKGDKRLRLVIDATAALAENGARDVTLELDPKAGTFHGRLVCHGSLTGRNGGVEIFFAGELRSKVTAHGAIGDKSGRLWVEVEASAAKPLELFIGLSTVSSDQAHKNLAAQVGERSFDQVRQAAEHAWRGWLSKIDITGGAPKDRSIFYTALYHSLVMPTDMTEEGGVYRGLDAKVHQAKGFRYHTDLSLWDTFRTQQPLLLLLDEQRALDIVRSLEAMAKQGGYLPKWPTGYRYTSCMIGSSADIVIAESYLKGLRGFDVEACYQAAKKAANGPIPGGVGFSGRRGIEAYLRHGYVTAERSGSVSRTIEFSYADGCLAALAEALGHNADANTFEERSRSWRRLWDGGSGYLRARNKSGGLDWRFVSWTWLDAYTEGNARQWMWAPLHDVSGLIELCGGDEAFVKRLDTFFQKSVGAPDTLLPDPWYWHGNEPDIHAAYLFNRAGRHDLTERWVRWVRSTKYRLAPNGLDGNDDCGTLSAWYVWSALGIYPVAGTARYEIGTPLFERAVIKRSAGDLVIEADAPGRATGRALMDEVAIKGWSLNHDQLRAGGTLRFEERSKLRRP